MNYSKSFGSRLFNAGNYFVLSLVTLMFILPFVYMFSVSISDPVEVAKFNVTLFPIGFNVEAYQSILSNKVIITAYWNSIRYTVLGTLFTLFITCLAAYPLALSKLKYKSFFTVLFTITMFFHGGLIPTFLLIQRIGFIDTIWAVTVPGAFSFWFIIIMRTNFQSLPVELYESAYIDGANDWKILFQIVLPLSKAIIATIALFSSVGIWNSFFGPLLYLNSADMQPLSIILRRMLIANEVFNEADVRATTIDPLLYTGRGIAMRMAAIFITIGPIVLVYPFVQKYFVEGVLVGSVKG